MAITEYAVTGGSRADGITAGPDGALWFTEVNGTTGCGAIGRSTTSGSVTEAAVATGGCPPLKIITGPDGALWFTEVGDKTNKKGTIGRVTTGGAFTAFPVPTASNMPFGITEGADGALWFTEQNGQFGNTASSEIGRISTSGAVIEHPLPSASSVPFCITAGPDGALWFTEAVLVSSNNIVTASNSKIGRLTTSGSLTEYSVPTAGGQPFDITTGPDGALWFTEALGNKIGRVTTTGAFAEYTIPTTGAFAEYPIPTASSNPLNIVTGSDNALWFSEGFGDHIARLHWNNLALSRAGYREGDRFSNVRRPSPMPFRCAPLPYSRNGKL